MSNPGTTEHGIIRSDFPGGWEGDEINAFTGEGLSDLQKEAQQYLKKLLNWRKGNKVIHNGELKHYNPKQDIYVLFRYTEEGKVMTVLSKNKEDVQLDLSRFSEMINSEEKGVEVITGMEIELKDFLLVPSKGPMIIDIK